MNCYIAIDSPLGELYLIRDASALIGLYLAGQKHVPDRAYWGQLDTRCSLLREVQRQLDQYFQHQRRTFDLPLNPMGTDFQKQVWQQLRQISYGQTWSYGELAQSLGQPTAARAVGAANGRNPIAIIIPCHRVIARNGKLTGYAGGVDRKQWLLSHEGMLRPQQRSLFT